MLNVSTPVITVSKMQSNVHYVDGVCACAFPLPHAAFPLPIEDCDVHVGVCACANAEVCFCKTDKKSGKINSYDE